MKNRAQKNRMKKHESCSNMEDDEDVDGSTLTEAASNIANSIIKM